MWTDEGYRKKRHRHDLPNCARAINFSCFHNQPFLKSERACAWLSDAMNRFFARDGLDVWAWCFMPTHVHVMVYPRQPCVLGATLFSIKKSVTNRVVAVVVREYPSFAERMLDSSGAMRFWQEGGGYDRSLWEAKATHEMIEYIHDNPVADGLCERPEDWTWSSSREYRKGASGAVKINLEKLPVWLRK